MMATSAVAGPRRLIVLLSVTVLTMALAAGLTSTVAGQSYSSVALVKACTGALVQDYYSYSKSRNMLHDFYHSIDAQTFNEMKQHASAGVDVPGLPPMNGEWSTFQQRFASDREMTADHRSEQEASATVMLYTSNQAFHAYETCLKNVQESGPGLKVWATTKTDGRFLIHVSYLPSPGQTHSVNLSGTVMGGFVTGAPVGRLWKGTKTLAVNGEDIVVDVMRTAGTAATSILLSGDQVMSVAADFARTDGELEVIFPAGTTDVVQHLRTTATTVASINRGFGPGCEHIGEGGVWCGLKTPVALGIDSSWGTAWWFANPKVTCDAPTHPIACADPTQWPKPVVSKWRDSVTAVFVLASFSATVGLEADVVEAANDIHRPFVFGDLVELSVAKNALTQATLTFRDATGRNGVVSVAGPQPTGSPVELVSSRESVSATTGEPRVTVVFRVKKPAVP